MQSDFYPENGWTADIYSQTVIIFIFIVSVVIIFIASVVIIFIVIIFFIFIVIVIR